MEMVNDSDGDSNNDTNYNDSNDDNNNNSNDYINNNNGRRFCLTCNLTSTISYHSKVYQNG